MILLTYVASLLGGVLQAAYMVFGIMGGPIFGIFTLGMTNPWSNNIGACVGFITGAIATSWAGVGAFIYKPYVYKPSVSLAQCDIDNATGVTSMYLNYSTTASPVLRPDDKPGYLIFYELSYLWFTLFAVIVVNVVGTAVSLLTGASNREDVDPRLLTPIVRSLCCCLPARLRRCNIDETRGSFRDGQITQSRKTDTTSQATEVFVVDTII